MRELFVFNYYDTCEVIHMLDDIGISGSMRCGCLNLGFPTCVRQTKGTAEYREYKKKFAKGDKDIWYNCPNGTFFEIPDDRLEEAKDIRAQVEKDHFFSMLKRKSRELIEKLDWGTHDQTL